MAGVAFYFEDNDIDVYSGRVIDLDAWYLASLIPGDITDLLVVNKTNANISWGYTNTILHFVDKMPQLSNAVFLDPTRGKSLWDLDHSKVEWYVFGPADGWPKDVADKKFVHIPQATGAHCHSQHVMTAVMFHRYSEMTQ